MQGRNSIQMNTVSLRKSPVLYSSDKNLHKKRRFIGKESEELAKKFCPIDNDDDDDDDYFEVKNILFLIKFV